MGGALPVNASTQREIQDLIQTILTTFSTNYIAEYTRQLVKKCRLDYEAAQKDKPMLVHKIPLETENVKEGWLTKEGFTAKNWKKRYFIVRPNTYHVDYYETDVIAKDPDGKPKGQIHLQGYKVIDDPGSHGLKKLKKLLKTFGMEDERVLPKPKQYPDFTFEIHHKRRRCYFIQAASQQEKDQWMTTFKFCCQNARSEKLDFVNKNAFDKAIWRTRWKLGRYGWWSYGGTQEEVLSDLVVEHINYAVMSDIYRKLTGVWFLRYKLYNIVKDFLDRTVGAATKAAWKAMSGTIAAARPTIEAKLKENLQPLFEAQTNIKKKIIETIMSVVDPVMQEMVAPHLERFANFLCTPINKAHDEMTSKMRAIMTDIAAAAEQKGIEKTPHEFCVPFIRRAGDYWDTMRPCNQYVETLYEPLNLLGELIRHLWPWSVIYKMERQNRKLMQRTVATFEVDLVQTCKDNTALLQDKTALKAACIQIADRTMLRMAYDSTNQVQQHVNFVCQRILLPPFEKKIIPMVVDLVKPISNMIPEPLKILIDIDDMLESTLLELVCNCIASPLQRFMPALPPRPQLPILVVPEEGQITAVTATTATTTTSAASTPPASTTSTTSSTSSTSSTSTTSTTNTPPAKTN